MTAVKEFIAMLIRGFPDPVIDKIWIIGAVGVLALAVWSWFKK
jgi:hypothetical protein